MNILVLNAGSSSLKYQLFDMENITVIAKGNVERIGEKGSDIKDHKEALESFLPALMGKFDAIGHRVVHGGEYFKDPVIIDDEVIKRIEECTDLAPLHNPANLQAILACKELLPQIKQVGVFDTAFHQSMEPAHYLYPIPYHYYEHYKIRRYGFHGTSHKYVYEQLITNYKLSITNSKVITCHVGNGVSVTAIQGGKVIETSMGMTPLQGTMMGTRSGDIDPAIIPYLMKHEELSVDSVMDILNKQSGLVGISGASNDMRVLLPLLSAGEKKAKLALDMYMNSLVKYVGSYAALMGGVDVIVLTGGVMEHRKVVRELLLSKLGFFGIALDEQANTDEISQGTMISTKDSRTAVFVIPTNEELMIAKETQQLLV